MIQLIIVSHSPRLADGLVELAGQMSPEPKTIHSAAGIDDPDNPIGTDALRISAAIEAADNPHGTLILLDLGSALLSAETALDLVDADVASRVRISAGPLVEGTISAAIAAGAGGDLDTVAQEAENALLAKQAGLEHLFCSSGNNQLDNVPEIIETPKVTFSDNAPQVEIILRNPHGLHARPAARLVQAMSAFQCDLQLQKGDKTADPRSLKEIAALQTRANDTITLVAQGVDASQALWAFSELAETDFGENLPVKDQPVLNKTLRTKVVRAEKITAPIYQQLSRARFADEHRAPSVFGEKERLKNAVKRHQDLLITLAHGVSIHLGESHGDIFSAQALMLEELSNDALESLDANGGSAAETWLHLCDLEAAALNQLEDPYLRARSADILDLQQNILTLLNNVTPAAPPLEPHIFVADDIFPSQVFCLGEYCRAVVLAYGSDFSHAAILLKALNIPLMIAAGEEILDIPNQTPVMLDFTGQKVCLIQ